MTWVRKPVQVIRMGKHGYGYGYQILYPWAFEQAQEHLKPMRNDWDRAKTLILAHLRHFLPVSGVRACVSYGFTHGLWVYRRVRVRVRDFYLGVTWDIHYTKLGCVNAQMQLQCSHGGAQNAAVLVHETQPGGDFGRWPYMIAWFYSTSHSYLGEIK